MRVLPQRGITLSPLCALSPAGRSAVTMLQDPKDRNREEERLERTHYDDGGCTVVTAHTVARSSRPCRCAGRIMAWSEGYHHGGEHSGAEAHSLQPWEEAPNL
jgi:hypothetical protein